MKHLLKLLVAGLALGACSRVAEPEHRGPATEAKAAATAASAAATSPLPTAKLSAKISRPAPERLVAIGDLHGDIQQTRRALKLAGAIDGGDRWIGGKLVVVQTGDAVDRGDDDRAILELFEALKKQAAAAGGEVIAMLGNHEIMNASLDFRYVTKGGFTTFPEAPGAHGAEIDRLPSERRGRAEAFAPGGPFAAMEATRPVVMVVGGTVFAHGGVLPAHVRYGLDRLNDELDAWLLGKRPAPPSEVVGEDGVVWTRAYSMEDEPPACKALGAALAAIGAKRMVVGHTVQRAGINAACDGKVFRIDVGLSHYFGGPVQALEIVGDATRILKE